MRAPRGTRQSGLGGRVEVRLHRRQKWLFRTRMTMTRLQTQTLLQQPEESTDPTSCSSLTRVRFLACLRTFPPPVAA